MVTEQFEFNHATAPMLVDGQGPALVLLHGSADSPQAWSGVIAALAPQFRAYAPSLPILPAATPRALDHDLPWLTALIDHTGARHLAGHSYGALLALRWALANPGRLDSLLLAEPIAWGLIAADLQVAGTLLALRERCVAQFAAGEVATAMHWLVDYWNGDGFWARLPDRVRAGLLATAERSAAEVRSGEADQTSVAELQQLQLPTGVLAGAHTPRESLQLAHVLAAALPNAGLTVIAGAGHQFLRSHAAAVANAIATVATA